jgi:uncharacterized membrane protein (UPF0127 family)
MKPRKILLLLLLAVFLLPGPLRGEEYSAYGNPVTTVTLGGVKVKAEVVSTPEKLYLGLGNRKELPQGKGMLFVMPHLEVQVFCMRGMQFPLDLIWLRSGQVVGLALNISPNFPGDIISPVPVKYVLEVPAGFCERRSIKVGTPVSW